MDSAFGWRAKATVIEQFAPGAIPAPHMLAAENCEALSPEIATLMRVRVLWPLFVRVTVSEPDVPMTCEEKFSASGDSDALVCK